MRDNHVVLSASKKVTKCGGVTLPIQIRRYLNLMPGEAVNIQVFDDGSVLIQPRTNSCRFCGAPAATTHRGVHICQDCFEEIAAKFLDEGDK